MWKWSCPISNMTNEHHSFAMLDETLDAHERGINVPGGIQIEGFRSFPACAAEHEYWDDDVPCPEKKCRIPYIKATDNFDEAQIL